MTNVHWCCPDCEESLAAEDRDGAYNLPDGSVLPLLHEGANCESEDEARQS
jgi:hypothetical protein